MNYRTTSKIRRVLAIIMIALVALLLALMPAMGIALAEGMVDIPDEIVKIAEPLTWDYLVTVGGCALFVLIVVQMTKTSLDKLFKIPTAWYAYALAVVTMLLATAFTTGLTPSGAILTLFNGWVVACTASRTYDAMTGK